MTQTIDRTTNTAWGKLILTPDEQATDYLRRIHWWVRLFGIVWIVIPVAMSLFATFFLIGMASR